MSHIVNKNNPLTGFGELRTSQLYPVFQYNYAYTVSNTELCTTTTTNGGTVTQSSAMAVVATSTTTSSTALLKTKHRARYRAGIGGMFRFATLFTAGVALTEQYYGIFDETGASSAFKNGYGVGFDGDTFGFHIFQDDGKTSTTQANWDDPLDGTGPSGMTITLTNLNVFQIQYQYLGAGAIILSIEDDSTGEFVEVHRVHYTNSNLSPSVFNPNFHGMIWVDNGSTTSDMVIKSPSMGYFVEGISEQAMLYQPQFSTGIQTKSTVTTETAIMTIRNKSTYASITNFIDIILENISASIEASGANNLGEIRLVKDATLGGVPAYTDLNTNNSVVDMDTAGTTVSGGTTVVAYALAGKNDKIIFSLVDLALNLGPGETLTVAGTSFSSATIKANLLWKELF